MDDAAKRELLKQMARIVVGAAGEIRKVRAQGLRTQLKADHSPVTQADYASHRYIKAALPALMRDVPMISEEDDGARDDIENAPYFWLIDPLDGTKGFAKGGRDYAVNIALIYGDRPLLGAVGLPDFQEIYIGGPRLGAWRKAEGGAYEEIRTTAPEDGVTRILLSQHTPSTPQLEKFLAQHKPYRIEKISSALKFVMVAAGKADLYPRFAPTMEWDTAAPQAILEGAGGEIYTPHGHVFTYRKADWRNGHFICTSGFKD